MEGFKDLFFSFTGKEAAMSRVIAGDLRGRKLFLPEGLTTRPTTDQHKEAFFGVLQFEVAGKTFLDLFAGSGQMAVEALSRGALGAVLVEQDADALRCIRKNLAALELQKKTKVLPVSVETALFRLSEAGLSFDIIFLDPPYHMGLEEKTLSRIAEAGLLKKGGIAAAESSEEEALRPCFGDDLVLYKEKVYKTTRFSFYRRIEEAPPQKTEEREK